MVCCFVKSGRVVDQLDHYFVLVYMSECMRLLFAEFKICFVIVISELARKS